MSTLNFNRAGVTRADEATRSVWILIAFVAVSATVVGAVSSAFGQGFMDSYDTVQGPWWELPLAVRSTVWYVEGLLVSTAAWLLWTYPQPGIRRNTLALFAANLVLGAIARPSLLALFPAIGSAALWLSVIAVWVLFALLTIAAVRLRRSHRVSALLLVPCIVWVGYVGAVNASLALLN
jgi:benzodiazapine receptor